LVDVMAGDSRHGDARDSAADHRSGPDTTDRPVLAATVVRHQHSPDRVTVAPPDADGEDRLTTWLSIDADAVVSLPDAE
jgi:hypothetical protein